MKIAMIGHKRIPGREGGVEVVVEELSTRMAQLGHDVYVYNRYSKSRKNSRCKNYKNVNIITIPTIEKKSTDALIYSFLASIHALFKRYDVIHYHALGPSVMLCIPHLFGIRTIVTVHGLNYKTPKWKGIGAKFIRLGEKITAKYADEIIVLSKEQHDYFINYYNRETTYIPNGITLQNICQPSEIKNRWNLEKDSYLLVVSRIVPGKGIENLIEAYKKIKTDYPLIIAGESTFVKDFNDSLIQSIADDKRIKMIGFVSGKTLCELYSNAYLFVFPSEAEGMPMCLLEALSFNTPCLVSNIPENLEVGNNYVQTFMVSNVESLRENLECCILHRDELFTKDSRTYMEHHFDWNEIVKQTLNCYGGDACR